MQAYIKNWETWTSYDNTIAVSVDKEMLELIKNQMHTEITRAIESRDYEKAEDFINCMNGINAKLESYTEQETEEKE